MLEDELGICADLEQEMDELVGTYYDEWRSVVDDPERQKQFRQFTNTVRFCERSVVLVLFADTFINLIGRTPTSDRAGRRARSAETRKLGEGVPSNSSQTRAHPFTERHMGMAETRQSLGLDSY